jgi:cytochrome P450
MTATGSPESVAQRDTGKQPPLMKGRFLVGSAADLQRDRLAFLMRLFNECGDADRMRIFNKTIYHFFHPDAVKRILVDNHANYVKGSLIEPVRAVAGNGLLTNDGEPWLRQRRLMQPAFHRDRIARFGETMTGLTEEMLVRWETQPAGRPLDVSDEMVRLTMNIVSQTMFGSAFVDEGNRISDAIQLVLGDVQHRFDKPFYPPLSVPTPYNLRLRAAIRELHAAIHAIIDARRSSPEPRDDLLGMLMEARDDQTTTGMDDAQLRDEVVTMFVAGHETTARLLAWAFYLLDQHRDVEAKLHDELATMLGGRTPTMADLPSLAYTRAIADETLRLYPPVWLIVRQAVRDDEVMGFHVPAGALVSLSPYATHRHPLFWEEPDRFDPERFLAARSASRPKYAYIPFGGGPRMCIGNTFALSEAVLVLATVAQRYRLRLPPGAEVKVAPLATLQPAGGLPMCVERQTANREN